MIDIFLGTTKSNNDGTYSIPKSALSNLVFEDDCLDLYIKVYADDGNVSVHDGTDVLKHIYNDVSEVKSVTINEWNSSNTFIDFAAKMESSKGQAFQIYQAAIISRDYAQVMMGEQPENVFIYYPMNDSDGCHYLDSVNQIHITGIDVNGTMEPCPYDSWDVIMHEYGHHIEFIVDIIGITGYAHDFGENLADRTAYDKEIGIKVAWKEAWPTAFGMLAQMYYSYYTNDVNGANDTFYDAYNFRGAYSLENVDILDRTGEACETAIIALLWDLFDNTPSGDDYNDTLSFGHEKWWAITTKSRTYTFSDFIKNFYKEYPEYIGSMGEALSFYHMTTTNPVLDSYTTPSQTTPPTFTWEFQDSSLYYPNDVFELVIYDKAGKEILRSSSYTRDSTGKFTDTLTTSEWQKVLYSYGTTYKVAVSASQSGNPVSGLTTTHPVGPQTGEYISGWITLSKPSAPPLVYTISILSGATGKLREEVISLQPGQYVEYKVTFGTSTRRIVQTFGNCDTYMYIYDSTGAQVAFDQDNGYGNNAFINFNFAKDQQYTIRVKLYPSDSEGRFKLSITPSTSFGPYEGLYSLEDIESINRSFSLYPGNTTVLTFTPSDTGSYTFTIDSDFDTYIYVINPRSSEAVIRNGDYNDDDGEGQNPLLTKRLEAGVSYFIVVSAYNPNSMTSPKQVTLIVSKN